MIGQPHLEVLQELYRPRSPKELANELGYSIKHISEALKELEDIGLARKKNQSRPKIYVTTEADAVDVYRTLTTRHPNINFPELLKPSYLHVAYYLDEKRTAGALTKLSKPSRATVYRTLKELRNRGIVGKDSDEYYIREPYEPLTEFAQGIAKLKHISKTHDLLSSGKINIVWNNDYEHIALVKSSVENLEEVINQDYEGQKGEGEYYPTGLNELKKQGLKLMTTPESYLFYTEDDLRTDESPQTSSGVSSQDVENLLPPEDLVCQLLLIHRTMNKPVGQRYTLLYIAGIDDKLNRRRLRERAVHYDIPEEIDDLLRYVDERGDVKESSLDLPTWGEFSRVANEYEVEL